IKLLNMLRKILFYGVFLLHYALVAQQKDQYILLNNVSVFNGKDAKLIKGNVLVKNHLIQEIGPNVKSVSADTQIIDGKGGYVIPGMIDAHAHLLFESISQAQAMGFDFAFLNMYAAAAAKRQLLRGFTTVRDLGGGSLSLAKAIDMGLCDGPRVYSSGAFLSQTGGHGDFGMPTDVPRKLGSMSYAEQNGMVSIADGVDQVLLRAREQLRQGATQLKLMAGGGVASNYDPLDVMQYTKEEFEAAVGAAKKWGTYVTVHAYTPEAIQTAIHAGVKCIEHGQLADEASVKLMAEKGIWWSLQPFLNDDDAISYEHGSANEKKLLEMTNGTDNAYKLAKKYNIKVAWGTDCLFDAALANKQGKQLAKLKRWFTPYEILKMATSTNGELMSLCGKRNPYPDGKIGELSKGTYADLILVQGNPLENINLIEDPEQNFKVIIKNGIVYKNTL
ncbi:MAG: amidohydrolase family protein, partial [Flavobacterium sp.]|nr:amidohydrolase family protein [Candidatus Neoflavobacterium equi]